MDLEKLRNGASLWMLFDEAKTGDEGSVGGGDQPSGNGDTADNPVGGDGSDDKGGDKNDTPAAYRPEGLPDHLAGVDDKTTIDGLFKAYKGARDELAGKKNIPEKLDDYKIELPDDVAKVMIKVGEDGKDPIFEHMRGIFHKKGIDPQTAVELMSEYAGQISAAMNAQAADNGGENSADFDYKEYGGADKAQPVIDAHKTFITGLKNSGKLSDEAANELELLTYHSEGLKALNELRPLLGDKAVPADLKGKSSGGEVTEAILQERTENPKNRPSSRDYDPAYRAETDRMFREFYNGDKKTA